MRGIAWGSSSHRILRWLRRRRRLLAMVLFCLAVAAIVEQLSPTAPATQEILTARGDLPLGAKISDADFVMTPVPATLVPPQSFSSFNELEGRQLAIPLRSGQILTDTMLVGEELLADTPAGYTAVPLRLADPGTDRLLQSGQLVDILFTPPLSSQPEEVSEAPPPDEAQPFTSQVLARSVPVLWVSSPESNSVFDPSNKSEGLIVVAASPQQAPRLTGAHLRGKVSVNFPQ